MPENTNEPTVVLPVINITRNSVTIPTVTAKSRDTQTKPGKYYPQLPLKSLSDDQVIAFFGMEIIRQKLQQASNLFAQNTLDVITNEFKLPFDEERQESFRKAIEEFSVRGETLGDLEDRVAELTSEFVTLGEAGDMSSVTMSRIQKIALEIKATNAAIAEKKERYKRNKENEPAAAQAA